MIHPVLAFSIGQLELTANEASAFPPVAVGLIAVLHAINAVSMKG